MEILNNQGVLLLILLNNDRSSLCNYKRFLIILFLIVFKSLFWEEYFNFQEEKNNSLPTKWLQSKIF